MPKRNDPYPVVFPVRGLHEGVGYDIQPAGTTSDAVNVRGYDVLKNRLRGGRRAGLSKYFSTVINGVEEIQTMAKTVEGTAYATSDLDSRSTRAIDDTFVTYLTARPSNLTPDWTYLNCSPAASNVAPNTTASQWENTGTGLELDNIAADASSKYILLPFRDAGPGDVALYATARPQCTNASTSTGAATDCQCVGPFVRGTADSNSFIFATLIRVTDTTAQLQIISLTSAGVEAILAQSATFTLGGGAGLVPNLRISLLDDPITGRLTAGMIWPAAGAAGADLSTSVTVVNTTFNFTSRRCGVGMFGRQAFAAGLAVGTNFRLVTRVVAALYNDSRPAPVRTLAKTVTGTNRYLIPADYDSLFLNSTGAGSQTLTLGPYDSAVAPTNVPHIDSTNQTFIAPSDAVSTRVGAFFPKNPDTNGGPFDPEVVLSTGVTSIADRVLLACRFNAAKTDGIVFRFTFVSTPGTTSNNNRLSTITVEKWVNNDLSSTYITLNTILPFNGNSAIRVVDDGTTLTPWIDNYPVPLAALTTTDFNTNTHYGAGLSSTAGLTPGYPSSLVWRPRTPTGDDLPLASTSSARLLVAAGGTITGLKDRLLIPVTNGTNAMSTEKFQIMMQSAFNRTFMVDGTRSKVFNLATNQIDTWTATAGTLPSRCRLLALYRGRMVSAGKVDDPHNYFMAASGSPFNYDYSPAVTTVTQAVAGNNSDAGLIGDIITALIPFSDDTLIFGGDHTIYRMTGDPAAGGTVDLVSDQTGMAFGKAWAKDPTNMLYFWGQDGIYRMSADSGKPENMTKGRIDLRISSVDLAFNRILMEWNFQQDCLMVLIIPSSSTELCRFLVWDRRADAWWEDEYPLAIGPSWMMAYDSGAADDSAVIFGSRDSYLREIDPASVTGDDGTAITSRVRAAPFIAETHDREVILNTVMPVLGKGSGPVNLDVYTGQSAEDCQTAALPRVRRLIAHAGRNASMRHKVRGYAIQLALSHTGMLPWALEGLTAGFDDSGLPRAEVKSA